MWKIDNSQLSFVSVFYSAFSILSNIQRDKEREITIKTYIRNSYTERLVECKLEKCKHFNRKIGSVVRITKINVGNKKQITTTRNVPGPAVIGSGDRGIMERRHQH